MYEQKIPGFVFSFAKRSMASHGRTQEVCMSVLFVAPKKWETIYDSLEVIDWNEPPTIV